MIRSSTETAGCGKRAEKTAISWGGAPPCAQFSLSMYAFPTMPRFAHGGVIRISLSHFLGALARVGAPCSILTTDAV